MEADLVNPPPEEVMYTFDPIKLVVYREDDLEVTLEDFEGALDGIEKWVEEWKIERHTKLLHVMVSAGASPIEDPPTELDFNRLSLATTIFFCSPPYIYRSETLKALCLKSGGQHTASRQCRKKGQDWSTACLSYNTEAEEMVRQLVVAVGLDPETTTAAEMDAEDARFYCQGCPKWDKLARSWRNCVRLAFATPVSLIAVHFWEHPLSKFQGWIRLSAADTLTIIRQEHSNKADHTASSMPVSASQLDLDILRSNHHVNN
ncbi:hypothetical protein FRB96_004266 [Tulasnella sp. 330]|nr:hypothetical protein FRB96_004266 [Tulasnella sp. 330]